MVALAIYRDGPREAPRAPPKTATKIVDCGKCHACCIDEAVFLYPEEGDRLDAYQTVAAVNPANGQPGYMLQHKANEECFYLVDGRCSIWANRPIICRIYDCGELWAQTPRHERKQLFGGPGKAKYEAARDQWRRRQPAKP